MRNKKLVDRIMQEIYPEFRYRWCEAGPCACMGCVNGSERHVAEEMGASPLTKEEWQRWVEDNKLITIEYEGQEYSRTAKEWLQDNAGMFDSSTEKCEHKTSKTLFGQDLVHIERCTWICGAVLVSVRDDNGISHSFTVDELLFLASLIPAKSHPN